MKTAFKIIFASALALSTVAPALAYESNLEFQSGSKAVRAQHIDGTRSHVRRALRGTDARAYEPDESPAGADFGIGSQR